MALDQDDSVSDKYFEQIFIKKEDIFESQTKNILSNFVSKKGNFWKSIYKVVHVSHNVTAFEFFYEPFYVSLDSAPLYDERFEGYGFTRNTQVFMIEKTTFQKRP